MRSYRLFGNVLVPKKNVGVKPEYPPSISKLRPWIKLYKMNVE